MVERTPLIVGNWKMNGSAVVNAQLLSELQNGIATTVNSVDCQVAVCVPFPYLAQVESLVKGTKLQWGAQDVSMHTNGAYTGEVSAPMLRDFSCAYTIVGHSERRGYHKESDEQVGQKAVRLLEVGITPIVCVGETLQERKDGLTEVTVARQLKAVLSCVDKESLSKIVVAYEPVWAIGTGVTATPQMAQEVHAFLREQLSAKNAVVAQTVRILYGGSMKMENAPELLAMNDIDGGLIGGASLKAADFLGIVAALNK